MGDSCFLGRGILQERSCHYPGDAERLPRLRTWLAVVSAGGENNDHEGTMVLHLPCALKTPLGKHSRNTRFMLFCLSSGGCKSLATPGQVPCDQVSSSCHPILQCTQTLGEGGVPSVNKTWHLPSVSIRRHPGIQESGGWLSADSSWDFQGMGQEGSKIPTRSGG